jgi:hypothetical protein
MVDADHFEAAGPGAEGVADAYLGARGEEL